MFKQGEDESLYTAWERYKRLLKRCPMGHLSEKNEEEARQLIEDLAKCNMKAPSESSMNNSRTRGSGVIKLNKMTAVEAKLDAIMHRLGNQEKRMHSAHEIGAVERDGIRRSAEGPIDEDPIKLRGPSI